MSPLNLLTQRRDGPPHNPEQDQMARARPAPLNRFNITSPDLPGVSFKSIPDLYENAPLACIAQTAVDEFAVDGDEITLTKTLRRLCCWDDESIKKVIANPRKMPPITYGWPADYGMHPVEPAPAAAAPEPIAATVQGVVDSALDALREFVGCADPVPA
jgi:hypothetical protein